MNAAPPMIILRPTKFQQDRAGGILLPENGKLVIRCQPANMLLTRAFNWSRARMILDAPLPDGLFDYLVTLPEKQEEALQQKIREQLQLVGRREMRDTAVYIVSGKKAPELKPGSVAFVEQVVENGHYKGPMSGMWYSLECYLKKPVLVEIDPSSDCEVDLHWGIQRTRFFQQSQMWLRCKRRFASSLAWKRLQPIGQSKCSSSKRRNSFTRVSGFREKAAI